MNFKNFKQAVAEQFATMQKYPLYRTGATKDGLWETYIQSFPEGSNPVYRERTEHDCSCCKQFIRAVGNVVAIIDGVVVSIWPKTILGEPEYSQVSSKMNEYALSFPIENVFTHDERTAGTDKNFEQMLTEVKTWEHFFVNIPSKYFKTNPGGYLGEQRATFDVLKRGLEEISFDALDTVLDLIAQNSLYRGEEHKFALEKFKALKNQYTDIPSIWDIVGGNLPPAIVRIRNTSIGTLLVDLSEGMDIESAVAKFEAMVAPSNYKRPKAVVTKAMVEKAKESIEELGLTSALERRFAKLSDISVNNVLFADRSARKRMGDNIFDDLSSSLKDKVPSLDKVEEVTIEKFISDILPKISSMEVMVENRHSNNLVSLIAPVDPTAKKLFKWDNGFSWAYTGDMADSIKERVKAAGGNVTGELCCRLAWEYPDDLDFHLVEPNGYEIYFGNRRVKSPQGGMLDVDANGMDGIREHPVENIFYNQTSTMRDGNYELVVHNYCRRSDGRGFEIEIDLKGQVTSMAFDGVVGQSKQLRVSKISKKGNEITITPDIPLTNASKELWGINTHTYRKVNALMLSPNHWDGQGVGNKHYFFMIEGCQNDGTARPFYNEFLSTELDKHRKVMELVGSKMRTEESQDQLSGLGFSSTQRNNILCRVQGSFSRIINIKF